MQKPPIQGYQTMSHEWVQWFNRLWDVVNSIGLHGTTAQRPTTGLYINMQYLDETLGIPIWLQSVNPAVWINSAGASV